MGAVNIFLGGTGKYVAEDIQDNLDFYDLDISAPIAFDLNSSTSHSGLILRGLVTADEGTNNEVPALAREWQAFEPGTKLGPGEYDGPGPRLAPEHSVLKEIGAGIAENPKPTAGLYALRAHGLAVFSLLFDQAKTVAGSGSGNRLRNLIATSIRDETVDGRWPRINLVTSTAGGTGAGIVIPLALWLRQNYPQCPINLLAITPSAFSDVLKGTPSLAAKGRSGTYAIMRELSFLHSADTQTSFSRRELPITVEGLEYRPGQALLDRVYWFGGREHQANRDAFEEAGLLLRVLSWDDTANDLRAEAGDLPLQPVGALTAIEYPKLRLQRKIVFSVLLDVYRRLRENPEVHTGGALAADGVSLLDYSEQENGRVLGSWFRRGTNGPFATGNRATLVTPELARVLQDAVGAAAETGGWESIPKGVTVRPGIYDASQSEWAPYATGIFAALDDQSARNQRRIARTIQTVREEEEAAFSDWLQEYVIERRLSGTSAASGAVNSTQEVLQILNRLEREAEELDERMDDPKFFPVPTPTEVESRILAQQGLFENPGTRQVTPSRTDRLLAVGGALGAGLLGWAISSQVQTFTVASVSSEVIAYFAIILGAILAHRTVLWFRLRGEKQGALLSVRRRAEEETLFALMRRQDEARCVHWLHAQLRKGDGRTSLFTEFREQIRSARAAVVDLDKMYEQMLNKAEAESVALNRPPAHVREKVGDCLEHDPKLSRQVVPELLRRLEIDATFDTKHRARSVRVKLVHVDRNDGERYEPTSGDSRDMLSAAKGDDGPGSDHRQDQLKAFERSAALIVNWNLGQKLPADFVAALLHCANGDAALATETLATKLSTTAKSLPRSPSVSLPGITQSPRIRRLYAGSLAIVAELNKALGEPAVTRADRNILDAYHQNYRIVPSLGEQIVFFDLWAQADGADWAPHVISKAPEAFDAQRTYYGAERGVPDDCTARDTCFTILPEMLAATKIEMGGNVDPLAPAVCARLLGSDLDTEGPTYIELYYLLRARGQLVTTREGGGPDARLVTALQTASGQFPLVSKNVSGVSDAGFGAARGPIVDLDAFIDFMRFTGTPLLQGQVADVTKDQRAEVLVDTWARDPQRVKEVQRDIVNAWYEGDITSDHQQWRAEAETDLQQMPANGYRGDWERVVNRLISGDERLAIRRRHLTG